MINQIIEYIHLTLPRRVNGSEKERKRERTVLTFRCVVVVHAQDMCMYIDSCGVEFTHACDNVMVLVCMQINSGVLWSNEYDRR